MTKTTKKASSRSGTTGSKRGRKPNSSKATEENRSTDGKVLNEIWAVILLGIGAFLVIALQTQAAGAFGHLISDVLKGIFGLTALILPYYLILYGVLLFTRKAPRIGLRSLLFLLMIFLSITVINAGRFLGATMPPVTLDSLTTVYQMGISLTGGGVVGMFAGGLLVQILGKAGMYILSAVLLIISLMLVINTPLSIFMDKGRERRKKRKEAREALREKILAEDSAKPTPLKEKMKPKPEPPLNFSGNGMTPGQMKILDYVRNEEMHKSEPVPEKNPEPVLPARDEKAAGDDSVSVKLTNSQAAASSLAPEEVRSAGDPDTYKGYRLPPIDILKKVRTSESAADSSQLRIKAEKLEETMKNFNVNAKVIQVTQGPAITRYEIQPAVGVKVSSIVRLADDIALNLEAKSIRMEAPIPGKAAVGIEVENERVNLVSIRELIESKEFKNSKSKISFVVGKDIGGNAIVADLKSMPHLLIAGSTGSGKSVAINSILISMLYKARPDEVKFVLIDPKVVELGGYNGIPHLLIPVVTEPSKAAAALNWAVAEMTGRYKKFAEENVRDLESYNDLVRERGDQDLLLPQIVIIIDELADLMMAAPSQVEESICRLAQMARAAGMHLIVATQRPSVDIITGVIKANIPSRVAFAVSSQFDSRTILDMGGAEKLVGKGDMLFNPLGMAKPIRVQGTFVSDSEVQAVIQHLKNQGMEAEYSAEILTSLERNTSNGNEDSDEDDELLKEAIDMVLKAEQASVSMMQRRFRIGYNRAARMIDSMEARGIISHADGSRPRTVLMTEEEYRSRQEEAEE
jgi:S-DNA-T family DNA segregation ATPase FtsK/SpoIIIE